MYVTPLSKTRFFRPKVYYDNAVSNLYRDDNEEKTEGEKMVVETVRVKPIPRKEFRARRPHHHFASGSGFVLCQ